MQGVLQSMLKKIILKWILLILLGVSIFGAGYFAGRQTRFQLNQNYSNSNNY
jgi:disulfide bond formation protein DsbB